MMYGLVDFNENQSQSNLSFRPCTNIELRSHCLGVSSDWYLRHPPMRIGVIGTLDLMIVTVGKMGFTRFGQLAHANAKKGSLPLAWTATMNDRKRPIKVVDNRAVCWLQTFASIEAGEVA